MEGKRVVVTGGAGFVGSNLAAGLLELGAHVTVVDDFFTGKEDAIPNGCEYINGCVTDYPLMRLACHRADIVLHAAARNIIVSTANPADDFRVNAGGTFNVLLAARDEGVSRVVYTSSCSVYGDQSQMPIRETAPVSLLTPYAASKFAGEAYCQAFNASYGLRAAVVRYSNVYGPGQRPDNPYCGVVSRFLAESEAGRPMQLFGGGVQTRDYTYVGDIVSATLAVAAHPLANGPYNVATQQETTVYELASLIGGDVEYVELRDIDNVSRRALSIERIRNDFGWQPQITLEQGVELTRDWLEAKPIS